MILIQLLTFCKAIHESNFSKIWNLIELTLFDYLVNLNQKKIRLINCIFKNKIISCISDTKVCKKGNIKCSNMSLWKAKGKFIVYNI